MSDHQSSRWFHFFTLAVFAGGLGSLFVSGYFMPVWLSWPLVVLISAALISENASLPLPHVGTTSLAHSMTIAAALLIGPLGAGLVALSCTLTFKEVKEGKPITAILGNAGQLALSSVLPAWLYLYIGGRTLLDSAGRSVPLSAPDFSQILFPIVVLASTVFLMNALLVSIGLSLRDGISPLTFLRSIVLWMFPVQMSLAVLGTAIAQVMAIHPAAFVLLVFPLIVSRQVYQHYLVLKSLYIDTVRSLVAALEAKDPYTRGHSERVARYAVLIAQRMGLAEERIERLRMAAQLHDLGKVAIRSEVLQKPSSLDAYEHEEIRLHPETGASIVSAVPALGDLANIVRHHHERYDGNGYACGLSGDHIPFESRVLAIADSYDAMTTARAYRDGISSEEALREIGSCSGTQFDPGLVECFVKVVTEDIDEQ